MKKVTFFFLCLVSQMGFSFIPPLGLVIQDVFNSRHASPGVEAIIRHVIELRPNEKIEIEERLFSTRGKLFLSWKSPGAVAPYWVQWDRGGYSLSTDLRFPTRSIVFHLYLLATSGESVRDRLLLEQFIQKDQLFQYKPNMELPNDPNTWDLKEYYLQHPGISLSRINNAVAIAVEGLEQNGIKKTVYFDKELQGIRRFEWKEGTETTSWSFDNFSRNSSGFVLPHRMRFERGKVELITSELVQYRLLKEKQVSDFLRAFQGRTPNQSLTPNLDEALRILLSYR